MTDSHKPTPPKRGHINPNGRVPLGSQPPRPHRTALHAFADNSRHGSPWAAKLYADARRRGKRHPHAIRILGRAWLRVMWACWHTDTAYTPAKHRAEQRLATGT